MKEAPLVKTPSDLLMTLATISFEEKNHTLILPLQRTLCGRFLAEREIGMGIPYGRPCGRCIAKLEEVFL